MEIMRFIIIVSVKVSNTIERTEENKKNAQKYYYTRISFQRIINNIFRTFSIWFKLFGVLFF